MSLLKQLASLSNPAPEQHPESDETNDLTRARLSSPVEEDEGIISDVSSLRRLNAATLADYDDRYGGVTVDRGVLYDDDEQDTGGLIEDEESGDDESDTGENEDEQDSDEGSEGHSDSGQQDTSSKIQLVSADERKLQQAKGAAIERQLKLWDSLLTLRIKMQPIMSQCNELPRSEDQNEWKKFMQSNDKDSKKLLNNYSRKLTKMLDHLLKTRETLLSSTKSGTPGKSSEDDEEIPSSPEVSDNEETKDEKSIEIQKQRKRKLSLEDYAEIIEKQHNEYRSFRDQTLTKWYEKTRLATGRTKNKNFSAFDTNVLKQIEQILSDKNRLLKRTQTRRSEYKRIRLESGEGEEQDLDPEIFDDDDFYQSLLKELIERKSGSYNDPVSLSRQWLEIQKLRRKKKTKQVDTKASKGRKVRYDVHKKLVNFMAPNDTTTWSEDAKNELFTSLFA